MSESETPHFDDHPTIEAATPGSDFAETTAVGWRSRRMKPMWWLAMAAVFFLALWAWSELRIRTLRAQIAELESHHASAEAANTRLIRQKDQLSSTVRTLTAPDTRVFSLTGTDNARARLFVDGSGHVTGYISGLPAAPAEKTYQVWVSRSGVRQSEAVGTFSANEQGGSQLSVEMPSPESVRAVVVTLEPTGGSAQPTGARVLSTPTR
jgi:hypothetical protein